MADMQDEATPNAQSNQVDALLDDVIASAIHTQFIFSKAQFDNAKDSQALIGAANSNAEMLTRVVKYKVNDRIEELLVTKIEDALSQGKFIVYIGGKHYQVTDLTTPDPDTNTRPSESQRNN